MADRDNSLLSTVMSADFQTMLDHHPESFPALFYEAVLTDPETVAPSAVVDVAGSIEGSERKISYNDAVDTRAMRVPDDDLQFTAFESGSGEDTRSSSDPVVLMIKQGTVPRQSIISWTEKTGDDTSKRVSYYVLESKSFGKYPTSGLKHYCIPLMSENEKD